MKKIFVAILLFSLVALIVYGFDTYYIQDNITPGLSQLVDKKDAKIENLKLQYDDPVFWGSATKEADLIANSAKKGERLFVNYRLEIDEETTILPASCFVCLNYHPSDKWKKIVADDLLYWLAEVDEIKQAHLNNQEVKITGVIAKWDDQKQGVTLSVCDLAANGSWEYACVGEIEFTGLPSGCFGVNLEVRGKNNEPREYIVTKGKKLPKTEKIIASNNSQE